MPQVPADVLTFGGASVLVLVVLEAIKAVWSPTEAALKRFGPLLSILLGIVIVVGFALVTPGAVIGSAILTGIFAGATASGLYNVAKSGAKTVSTGLTSAMTNLHTLVLRL